MPTGRRTGTCAPQSICWRIGAGNSPCPVSRSRSSNCRAARRCCSAKSPARRLMRRRSCCTGTTTSSPSSPAGPPGSGRGHRCCATADCTGAAAPTTVTQYLRASRRSPHCSGTGRHCRAACCLSKAAKRAAASTCRRISPTLHPASVPRTSSFVSTPNAVTTSICGCRRRCAVCCSARSRCRC